ncbi:DUF6172 family protein [Pseudobacteriovorax antillogorgiicola]|uniref:Uncharacterized protein n=1 Tax=Pseudobacteriovorax antillogorgiicola TaxID=1513793 RepID=A0A1Y6BZ75_9BACT|nr:DUF6172 family protein [Pseudobacteriovorax antillogorgiicola]TCS51220.1 hypothetical protein EDD56_111105 [Pseudobacteriovorax antillogorgiicola]SMF36999.1 hypothetical protein SAMN06296036_11173 [Pseudobacteriovorax antillogorgiicola]
MKKTFSFASSNKKPERQVDAIKYEIKKYIGRERRKTLPEGADYWDFDCKIGVSEDRAAAIHIAEINKAISRIFSENEEGFYLEILAKPGKRTRKPDGGKSEEE